MSDFTIRAATPADTGLLLDFVHALARYERAPDAVEASRADFERALFGPQASAAAVICEQAGRPVGFALYFFTFSTWTGRRGLYLEDLYIQPETRGHGAGAAVMRHLARLAVAEDCARFEWSVLDWNTPAIALYQSIGASAQSEWTTYRLAGDALADLARG